MIETSIKGRPLSRKAFASLAILLAMLAGLPSCKKEYFELDRVKDNTWNPTMAVPLIKSTITVPEVMDRFDDQDIITVDPVTGLLALRYFSTVFSVTAEEWVELPATNITLPFPLTPQDITDITLNGSKTFNGTFNIPMAGQNGEEFSEIFFKGGNFDISVSSNVSYPATVTINIPGYTNGSTPYSTGSLAVPGNGSNSAFSPMAGRKIDLGLTPTPGVLEIQYSITFTNSGTAVPGQGLSIGFNVTGGNSVGGPTYAEVIGDFGQQTIPVDLDSVRLRIFDNDAGGVIIWDSALVRGYLTNTFGLAIQADLPTFTVKNTETGQTVPVTFPAGMLPLTIPTATAGYAPGLANFELIGNSNGANVNTVLNLNPNRLIYQGDLTANPGAGPYNNRMRDTSNLKLDIDVVLPFDGKALDFHRVDTADVKIFPLDGDVEEIVAVTIRLTLDNGFPADAYAQVYLYDTTGTVLIDSLFSETRKQIFTSPAPNSIGTVDQTKKVRTVTDIVMDRAKLEKLEAQGFGKVILHGWLDTFQDGNVRVKVFENYSMDMWLGMMVEAKVKIDF